MSQFYRQDDYPYSLLLLRQGTITPIPDYAMRTRVTNLSQVTGDLWERYLQLIADPKKTDG